MAATQIERIARIEERISNQAEDISDIKTKVDMIHDFIMQSKGEIVAKRRMSMMVTAGVSALVSAATAFATFATKFASMPTPILGK